MFEPSLHESQHKNISGATHRGGGGGGGGGGGDHAADKWRRCEQEWHEVYRDVTDEVYKDMTRDMTREVTREQMSERPSTEPPYLPLSFHNTNAPHHNSNKAQVDGDGDGTILEMDKCTQTRTQEHELIAATTLANSLGLPCDGQCVPCVSHFCTFNMNKV
jgi:hypothetical protein